jgi:hypothetical protein
MISALVTLILTLVLTLNKDGTIKDVPNERSLHRHHGGHPVRLDDVAA